MALNPSEYARGLPESQRTSVFMQEVPKFYLNDELKSQYLSGVLPSDEKMISRPKFFHNVWRGGVIQAVNEKGELLGYRCWRNCSFFLKQSGK